MIILFSQVLSQSSSTAYQVLRLSVCLLTLGPFFFLILITNKRKKLNNSSRALWRKAILKPGLSREMLSQKPKEKKLHILAGVVVQTCRASIKCLRSAWAI